MRIDTSLVGRLALATALVLGLSGCGLGLTGQAGPSSRSVAKAPDSNLVAGITIVDLDNSVVARLISQSGPASFARDLGDAAPVGSVVGPGDVLDVSIWEAPPAALFGGGGTSTVRGGGLQLSTKGSLPELLVGLNGTIFVPFAGTLQVSGRTLQQIEADITQRLSRKAHMPQVIVRIARNATANVTIVGDVANSTRMPLTPKGERLLDALAQAGGTRQPPAKTTIQVTRGDKVVSMALDSVIRDPSQNIMLSTGDVVTAIFQPYSFTALGASGKNEEVPFEGVGVSLAQALGRMGGLQDQRANAQGVFIFRWEKPFAGMAANGMTDPQGRMPVIYRVNMRDPATFFLAQNFAMQNGDVVYIATAPIAEFQQFVNVVASTLLPLVAAKNAVTVN